MFSINPKYSALISVAFAVVAFIGTDSVPLPDYIPAAVAHGIVGTCLWLGAIGNVVAAVLHANSPATPGPLAAPPPIASRQAGGNFGL
jgi:hypothetical protein